MKEREIREIYDFGKLGIITEKAKLPKYALAKLSYTFAKADSRNDNHRTYSEDILSREINRKSEELKKGRIAGQLDHPLSGITKLDKVAHVLSAVSYDRNTKLASAESYVLDTSKGRDFMVMMDAEIPMGCSMRGFGNVKNGYVQPDWKLDTLDFVLHPSFSDAMIDQSNIIESANNIFNEKDYKGGNMNEKMCGLSEDYVDELMLSCYGIYLKEENYKGDFGDFKKEMGTAFLAEILVAEGKAKDTDEALKHLKKFGETKRIPTIPIKEVTPAEIYLEARIANVDPAVYAKKLNEMNASLEESDSGLSPGEIIAVLEEARQAGFNMGDKDERKRMLDIVKKQKTINAITEDEKAEIVAKKTGSTKEFVLEIWAKDRKKKDEERIKKEKIHSRLMEEEQSGFGRETRPDVRKRSLKILDEER